MNDDQIVNGEGWWRRSPPLSNSCLVLTYDRETKAKKSAALTIAIPP